MQEGDGCSPGEERLQYPVLKGGHDELPLTVLSLGCTGEGS